MAYDKQHKVDNQPSVTFTRFIFHPSEYCFLWRHPPSWTRHSWISFDFELFYASRDILGLFGGIKTWRYSLQSYVLCRFQDKLNSATFWKVILYYPPWYVLLNYFDGIYQPTPGDFQFESETINQPIECPSYIYVMPFIYAFIFVMPLYL